MNFRIVSNRILQERDISRARTSARVLADYLGFSPLDQTRIATSVSEICRNGIQYAGAAVIDFELSVERNRRVFLMTVTDTGPGIDDLEAVLAGKYRSGTGMGMGLTGSRMLLDTFDVRTGDGGTVVRMGKRLPESTRSELRVLALEAAGTLYARRDVDPVAELEHQNGELLYSLQELRAREDQLATSNGELREVTNGLKESRDRNAFLLRELHHRVKNNLQVIESLVSLQKRTAEHEETRAALSSLSGRIRAIGFIHGQLYQPDKNQTVDLKRYLGDICEKLSEALIPPGQDVLLKLNGDNCEVGQETAQDIGLVVNELVTNACKHAFPDGVSGGIEVSLIHRGDCLEVTVKDDGVGLREDHTRMLSGSLGMAIIDSTVRKLNGKVEFDGADGVSARVTVRPFAMTRLC
ncbi:MAG: histidine kinase dimerization/phosphoacceptor domain -containing protein, partial [Rhodospirillaceae bacterium]